MSRKFSLSLMRPVSEINLTSMMDLTFLLLITFIITFPLMEQGITVNLPKGKASEISGHTNQTITLDVDGKLYLDNIPVRHDELAVRMNELGQNDPEASVMVRADERIQYGSVVKVLKILHDARVLKMALVTQDTGE